MQKIIIGVLVGLVMTTGFVAYKSGMHTGYASGWSDAHCGKGLDCEAGQE